MWGMESQLRRVLQGSKAQVGPTPAASPREPGRAQLRCSSRDSSGTEGRPRRSRPRPAHSPADARCPAQGIGARRASPCPARRWAR